MMAKMSKEEIDNLPPFFGVPFTCKECFEVKGMPLSTGLISRRHVIATRTSPAVQRAMDSGMILLGVTNTSELCLWMESHNELYGRTKNPYDLDRTVGGSSGGEGAIISSCGAPFGIGSDVGGSVRIPSFFNGLFGHKCTGGYVPNFATYPVTPNNVTRYCQLGPMVKYTEDMFPLFKIIAGPVSEEEKLMNFQPLKDPDSVDLRKLDYFTVPWSGSLLLSLPVSSELKDAQRRAVRLLEDSLAVKVSESMFKEFSKSFDIWAANMSLERKLSFHELMGEDPQAPPNLLVSILRLIIGSSDFTLPAIVLALLEKALENDERSRSFRKLGEELRAKLEAVLQNGVMLFPSHPIAAPLHNVALLAPFNFHYTGILNVLELPATQVTVGLNKRGVPLGFQVVSARHNDHLTIAVAKHLEKLMGGYQVPGSSFKH
jgi:fatty acid amide hydrolase 2